MIINSFVNYGGLSYQDYEYPMIANVIGIFFALSAASAIPIVGVYKFWKQKGSSFYEAKHS